VVDKPGGLLSVPGKGESGRVNLESWLRSTRPFVRMAHRLDQATRGLVIAAKDLDALRHLQRSFRDRTVEKIYEGIVDGIPTEEQGRIELPTRVDLGRRPLQIVDPEHGKWGVTDWAQVERRPHRTRVRFWPRTGRTHQIRIHARVGLGAPLLGDELYGRPDPGGLRLHATSLAFRHPDGGELRFERPSELEPW
jgi:tRNA pseudouridine32 synthase/23S rRNA pseudouridine746 synthase